MRWWQNYEAPDTVWYNVFTGDKYLEASNRKLIRPSLTDVKEPKEQPVRKNQQPKKPIPPDQTNAENFYYIKQMQSKTPMVIVLKDGEVLQGIIEWYDKASLKVNRDEGPNLLIYKSNIKYMYKASGT